MANNNRDICSVIDKLPKYSKLLVKLYKGRDINKRYKLLLSVGIAYSISPIELIPGIIPVAGQLDNLLVILRCLKKVLEASNTEVRNKYIKETCITIQEINEDIKITSDTLKSFGRNTVRVVSNTVKFAGYSALCQITKLKNKWDIKNR